MWTSHQYVVVIIKNNLPVRHGPVALPDSPHIPLQLPVCVDVVAQAIIVIIGVINPRQNQFSY